VQELHVASSDKPVVACSLDAVIFLGYWGQVQVNGLAGAGFSSQRARVATRWREDPYAGVRGNASWESFWASNA
jgi:hypothetical protein